MIKEINQTCEKFNNILGISVTLPNPEMNALKTAAAGNVIVGAGLIVAGIAFSSKSCAVLGGIGLISSAILRKESKNKARES